MITAELHDGRVLEFPDGTDPAVVQRVVKQTLGVADKPAAQDKSLPFGMQTIANLGGSILGGAGPIGATIMQPVDWAVRKAGLSGEVPIPFLDQSVKLAGFQPGERRAAIDEGLKSIGVDTDSLVYKGGKLFTQIAGTAGMGGALAKGLTAIPGVANAIPSVVNAVRTSGMTAGSGSWLPNLLTRMGGGAVTGGAAAGLVNPEDAASGAAIGAALPPVLAAGGKLGSVVVGKAIRGPEQTPEVTQAINAARESGYVIPPSQARPSLGNRMLEGLSGKITTAQNASAKNQVITNAKAARAIGLPEDAPITVDALAKVREQAGRAYAELGNTGMVSPSKAYGEALDKIAEPFKLTAGAFPNAKPSPVLDLVDSLRSPAFASSAAVAKIKELRTAADDAFRTGNTDIGRASKAAANALENAIEEHLQVIGETGLLKDFREARQLIAKTYTVEKALNPATGTIDARKLGQQITKGKPLSGDLLDVGSFALRFPKAAQPVEGMGSLPQTSPLDWAMGGGLAMGTGNPLMLASMAARPAARAAILSPMVQNRLAQPPSSGLLSMSPELSLFGYRAAPVFATADR